jgi:hypothetical protein
MSAPTQDGDNAVLRCGAERDENCAAIMGQSNTLAPFRRPWLVGLLAILATLILAGSLASCSGPFLAHAQ